MPSGNLRRTLRHPCGIDHSFRDVPVYLNAYRGLIIVCDQFRKGFPCIAYQPIGTDEFSVHHVRTEFLAHETEGCIGHILHRSQEQRPFPQVYIPYLHNYCGLFSVLPESRHPLSVHGFSGDNVTICPTLLRCDPAYGGKGNKNARTVHGYMKTRSEFRTRAQKLSDRANIIT